MRLRILSSLLILLCLTHASLAQSPEVKRTAWHVDKADVRFVVAAGGAWLAPVDAYLADLRPAAVKTLTFDAVTKSATPREVKKVKLVQGSATYQLTPKYRWFTYRCAGKVAITVDGKAAAPEAIGGNRFRLRLPASASALTLDVNAAAFSEAGFIIDGPRVARATLCLPGFNPTQTQPVVYTDTGTQVGAVSLWASAGDPLVVLFDSSALADRYYIYPVDKKDAPQRPQWIPQAGIILETRYVDAYTPDVKELGGFLKLWQASDYVAGKLDYNQLLLGFLPCQPMLADNKRLYTVPKAAPLALTRYVGYFQLPADDTYQFHFRAWQGGYVVLDGKQIIDLTPTDALDQQSGRRNPHKIVELKLKAGSHRFEAYQYGQYGQFEVSLGWSSNTHKQPRIFGSGLPIINPIVSASTVDFQQREQNKPHVSFAWPYRGSLPAVQCRGRWPAEDIVQWQLVAEPAGVDEKTVDFRWRFEDGHVAAGKQVEHVFLQTGMRKVHLDMLDKKTGKVLADSTGELNVQFRPDWPESKSFQLVAPDIEKRKNEFAKLPIESLLSLHAWTLFYLQPTLREAIGATLGARFEEVQAHASDARLLHLGRAFASPDERRYAPAQKVLRAAFDKAPAGSVVRQQAALALADVLTGVAGQPGEALELLEKTQSEHALHDWTTGWQMAVATEFHARLKESTPEQLTRGLVWEDKNKLGFDGTLPLKLAIKDAAELWLRKNVAIKDTSRPLVVDLGTMLTYSALSATVPAGMVWVNGKAVGGTWRWHAGRVIVPAKLCKTGDNEIVVVLQAATAAEFYGNKSPTFEVRGNKQDLARRFQWQRAEALAHLDKLGESRKILANMPSQGWPLTELQLLRLAGRIRSIRHLADSQGDDPASALVQLNEVLDEHPLLRFDAEWMVVRAKTYLGLKEYQRAFLLADQILKDKDMSGKPRRELLLTQVEATTSMNLLDRAQTIYKHLAKIAPLSPETVQAREAIIRAVKTSEKDD